MPHIKGYRVGIFEKDTEDEIGDDEWVWFPNKDQALAMAKAVAAPGSLSADPGDRIVIEEIREIATIIKPEGE